MFWRIERLAGLLFLPYAALGHLRDNPQRLALAAQRNL